MDDAAGHHRHHTDEDELDELEDASKRVERKLARIFKQLDRIETMLNQLLPGSPVTARLDIGGNGMDTSVKDDVGTLNATVAFKDASGHDTQPDDVPQWTSSDASVATVDASGDASGKSAVVTVLAPGATVIEVDSTDTDGTVIKAAGTLTVTGGEPATGEVTFA